MTSEYERILPRRDTSLGWSITEIGYEHVPGYDFEEAKRGLSPQSIQTELMRNWQASSGKLAYPEYNQAVHVSPTRLVYDPNRMLYVGIDMPGTPAAVITQIDAFDRWCILHNISPPEDETIGYYEFGEVLAEVLLRDFAEPHHLTLEELPVKFYGDPAGNATIPKPGQSPKEARSCWDILRNGVTLHRGYDKHGTQIVEQKPGWGWTILPGEVSPAKRMEVVRARLTTLLRGGVPALVIDPECRTVISGFGGGYHYPQDSLGRYSNDILKNHCSHTMNALEYAATRLFARPVKDDRDKPPRREQRSRSAARYLRGG
jgi:hypothetical protein